MLFTTVRYNIFTKNGRALRFRTFRDSYVCNVNLCSSDKCMSKKLQLQLQLQLQKITIQHNRTCTLLSVYVDLRQFKQTFTICTGIINLSYKVILCIFRFYSLNAFCIFKYLHKGKVKNLETKLELLVELELSYSPETCYTFKTNRNVPYKKRPVLCKKQIVSFINRNLLCNWHTYNIPF